MSRFNKSIISVAVASAMLFSTSANATGAIAGATEITQILNNSQLLMQVIEAKSQTVAQVKQLYELYKTAEREVLHLKSIGSDVARLATLAKEKDLGNLMKMINLTESIYGDVSGLGTRLETRYQEAYNQGLSIKDYILNEGKKVERKEKQAVARVKQEQSIIDHLKDDLNDISNLATKIPLSEGTQQSMGLMNTQLNKLLVSMNRIGQIIQAGQENVKKAQDETDALLAAKHASKFAENVDKATKKANSTSIAEDFNPMSGSPTNAKDK